MSIINPTPGGFTSGSVIFAGASGQLTQDNANFFWDNVVKLFRIGTAVSTGGAAGELIIPQGKYIRSVNEAGTNTIRLIGDSGTGDDKIAIAPGGQTVLLGVLGAFVGIGDPNPDLPLSFRNVTAGGSQQLRLENGAAVATNVGGGISFSASGKIQQAGLTTGWKVASSADSFFAISIRKTNVDTEVIRLQDGNCGVGTTGPTQLLSVAEAFQVNASGNVLKYRNVATQGWGVPAIYGSGLAAAQVAAVASVATYTVGAADGGFLVSAHVLVTASTTHAFTIECAYTDAGSTARVLTFPLALVDGTWTTSVANANGTVPYHSATVPIRAKASTAITIRTQAAGTYTSVTFTVQGSIAQIA